MKCIPIIRSGLSVIPANLVIEMEEVLLAKIVSGLVTLTNYLKISAFISYFSGAASTTKSQHDKSDIYR